MTRVIGLFSSEQDVGSAMDALEAVGIARDAIEQIDRQSFKDDFVFGAAGGDTILAGTQGQAAGVVPDETEGAEPDAHLSDRNIADHLEERNVPDDEVDYYARRVYKGGILLLVDVDEEQADQVVEVLKQHNVQVPHDSKD